MEQINKAKAYIYITLLLAFTSFEFFFRDHILLFVLALCAVVDVLMSPKKFVYSNYAIGLIFIFIIVDLLQLGFKDNININYVISQFIMFCGILCIANIVSTNYIKCFTNIITFIAIYSLAIYLICLFPDIKTYLYNHIASNGSLNVEEAVQKGGGRNFIIYNFQTDFVSEVIGYSRNCGPFWEPGMFAVFLIIALFFNVFLSDKPKKYKTIILVTTLISTFSTGGFMVALLLVAFYIINTGLTARNIMLFIPVAILTIAYVMNLEYIGEKTMHQFNTATVGSDESRYGAFITQLDMIGASPLIGGEKIADYAKTKTLASGTLWPLVQYGVIAGVLYYISLLRGCFSFIDPKHMRKIIGWELFILLIALSFSQTILLNMSIILMIFSALINNSKNKICLIYR